MDVRVIRVLRSTGRTRSRARPSAAAVARRADAAAGEVDDAPSSLVRELLSVWGRMNAPLSPSTRTGARLVRVRRQDEIAAGQEPRPEPGGERRA